ncbi:hypothetical protein A8C56_09750 [Niabella ginsenosidivorans]|uniref:Haem-binding uptake Tiki superfamily ChaN domain-containing protein n=1 Tax=Niabella ginsenosidivorans TaxID=1176587 RepID=A0A1A9I2E5_9BACT|nr:hypothetical protein [Niabella ginsenosidivorans]ANH81229.1 hypothetical protein A8C56_09750 [Niabella ginsenosidivorans]
MRGVITLIALIFPAYLFSQELTIIGNAHVASESFNADTLFTILEKVKPDIILLELDSGLFSKTFDEKFGLKYKSKENEPVAIARYIELHPLTIASHFDYENRDTYRLQHGIKQSQNLTGKLLDSLYRNKLLRKRQTKIVKKYYSLTEELNSYANKPASEFNSSELDKLAKRKQIYQHHKIRKVINQRDEFSKLFVTTILGTKVSVRNAYSSLSHFWDLRNKTMAKNIVAIVKQNPAKRIVVLTGFSHRYFLKREIHSQYKRIKLREFYEY